MRGWCGEREGEAKAITGYEEREKGYVVLVFAFGVVKS